jgi:hypothetical protein
MKKYLVGAIIGVVLSISITAYAEDVKSLVGRAVEGSFPLLINGQKADKDVIVIDGTSYVPVRVAGELFGYDVGFIDSQVVLKAKEGVVNMDVLEKLKKEADEKKELYEKLEKEKEENIDKIKEEEAAAEAEKQRLLEEERKFQESLKK